MPGALARLDSALGRWSLPISTLLARLVFGFGFFRTGLGKWRNFDHTVDAFTAIGIPWPTANAGFVSTVEVIGGLCLMIGFGVRIATLFLTGVMVVAILTAHWADVVGILKGGGGEKGLTDIAAVVFLVVMLLLMTTGSGPISADHYLKRRKTAPA